MPNLIEITEFSAPELDVYARLPEVQLRSRQDPSQALFIAESPLVIGRALVQETDVLLLDEPTNNLDMANQVEVMHLVRNAAHEHDIACAAVMFPPPHGKFWPGSVRTCPFSRRRMPCSRS